MAPHREQDWTSVGILYVILPPWVSSAAAFQLITFSSSARVLISLKPSEWKGDPDREDLSSPEGSGSVGTGIDEVLALAEGILTAEKYIVPFPPPNQLVFSP